ncbi:hypothetical protein HOU02_gp178 [Caulobacter phage CcrBL9]|uniref:Uncharacterized protein n=1 Tax=Caulobacter phage CcrBL9 TaxID=2283270 RepID=A0A385EAV6_9CAUD|nr:hypothetical protein HOU02_gp007 [Caulobacter phage CcrBL9]YP_009810177.1 hypothetical protein HOU02_gp178 [Caulobacter phage CcrBL9]AXQ69031.1 hypothetical protein CcrBL9_gp007 [Caulobacter phage CcrBL9]AXQ69547.1 hypothetical protein CcrBL9_gp523 [Caulobacter phage CcrBL9]
MALVTESFVVDIDCTRALTAAERRGLAGAIAQVLGVNIDRVEPEPGGFLTANIGRVRPAGMVGASGQEARIKTEALTSRDHDAPVALTLEAGERVDVIARFYCMADAETYLNENPDIDPVSLNLGCYGIDAPFGVASDADGDKLLYELGYRLHATGGGSWSFTDPKGYLWDGGGKREAVVMIALKQAADAEEA